eukprot:3232181-Rhodomonas_salina.2
MAASGVSDCSATIAPMPSDVSEIASPEPPLVRLEPLTKRGAAVRVRYTAVATALDTAPLRTAIVLTTVCPVALPVSFPTTKGSTYKVLEAFGIVPSRDDDGHLHLCLVLGAGVDAGGGDGGDSGDDLVGLGERVTVGELRVVGHRLRLHHRPHVQPRRARSEPPARSQRDRALGHGVEDVDALGRRDGERHVHKRRLHAHVRGRERHAETIVHDVAGAEVDGRGSRDGELAFAGGTPAGNAPCPQDSARVLVAHGHRRPRPAGARCHNQPALRL